MKAAVNTQYGPPEVISIKEVTKPVPKENEVLIKVFASTVNRTDCGFRSAEYVLNRLWSGLINPNYLALGCEFAGQVEAIGNRVTSFKVGDKVFGFNTKKFGGHAEYLTLNENDTFTTLPANFTYEQAAPLTEGAHYALNNIRAAKVTRGQNVLVYGATGAIGSAAVQLLKHFGAHVTAVCNTARVDMVKSLGADVVINYEKEDFTQTRQTYSFIFDAVGKSSFGQCKPLLTSEGTYISTELGKKGENLWKGLIGPFKSGKKILFPIPILKKEDLLFLKALAEAGKFSPVIDRYYNLDQIVEAHRYVESGQKTGNVVFRIIGDGRE
ncbi:NAD(P)-dependent alcohol dehydrogenase [Adhaeribacter soli]|uniref:NAD(P)-dependent alcohol dehydrogenase n=1 Tax=Adhaeribacter soli TaxID=2607655 RepID=A0A5N1IS19_9BACT|nr:NAD(P)-dependent alcohol dehydrogenase [Adhaeribacter soli]KAA9332844.1 NAD(P)-dependent alcohol dehydrogenase [Adhaeribacter soli]